MEQMTEEGPGEAGSFQAIRTAYVDVKALSIGREDPSLRKLDVNNELLAKIEGHLANAEDGGLT